MTEIGELIIAGAVSFAIVAIALAIAENIQRANALEVRTPYSSLRTAKVRELYW